MTLRADGPVGSGQTYRVTEVNGRIPDILDDFAGGYAELVLHKDGDACRVVGEGMLTTTGEIRFHQKHEGPDDKDVRIWLINDSGDGTFCAEPIAAF
jgi:hypothetical protein